MPGDRPSHRAPPHDAAAAARFLAREGRLPWPAACAIVNALPDHDRRVLAEALARLERAIDEARSDARITSRTISAAIHRGPR